MLGFSALNAAEQRFPSHLTEATIYLRGAALTFTAEAKVVSGAQDIEIEGLSPNIDLSSLKVQSSSGVLISATEFSQGKMKNETLDKELQSLRSKLAEFNSEKKTIENRLEINANMLELLSDGIEGNIQKRQGAMSASEISASLELYRKNAESIYKQMDSDKEKLEPLNKTIKETEAKIAELESKALLNCGVLKLSVVASKAGNVSFTISYFTSQASWTPYYDINVASTEAPVSLSAKAEVRQNTGIDWKNVKITLSNGTPSRTNVAPELSAWYVGFRPETRFVTMSKNSAVMAASYDAMPVPMVEEEMVMMDDYVDLTNTDLNVVYAIALPYDIAGNGVKSVIDLKKYDLAAEYYYYSAPRISEEVYLMASISDWERNGLLPGQAVITYGGDYVGKTYFNTNTTENKLELTLGTDQRITVKREVLKDLKANATVGNSTTVYKGWQITVRGSHNRVFRMVLKDQYPLSTDKDIDVKVTSITPSASYNNTQNGIVTWEFNLAPGEVRTFSLSYSVKYPKDRTVVL